MPPPDKKYISKAYSALKDNLEGFSKSPEEFEKLVVGDKGYRQNVYNALKDNLVGFDKTLSDFETAIYTPDTKQPVDYPKSNMLANAGGAIQPAGTYPQPTLKDHALKDKQENNSYLGALWNNVVASGEALASGAVRALYNINTRLQPGVQGLVRREAFKQEDQAQIKAGKPRIETQLAEKAKNVVGKARTESSSRENEQKIQEGFDVTDGIGFKDVKALGAMAARMGGDIGAALATGGSSFVLQGYDNSLADFDSMPEAENASEGTRQFFGVVGGIVSGVTEKLGLDKILKNTGATRYITAKVTKEITEELTEKGLKVSADQLEKLILKRANTAANKALNVAATMGKAGAAEGVTEMTQEAAMDLTKAAVNAINGKDIFDEDEIIASAGKRYLNSLAAGAVLGGAAGSVAGFKNIDTYIDDKLSTVKTPKEAASVIDEVNESIADGTLAPEDAEVILPIIQEKIDNKVLAINDEIETQLGIKEGSNETKQEAPPTDVATQSAEAVVAENSQEVEVKPQLTDEQKVVDATEATEAGFTHPTQALNSVNKREGTDYKTFQEIPKEQLQKVSKDRSAPQPIQEFQSKQGHTLKVEDGEIKVYKTDGTEVVEATAKKVIKEAAESYDFTQGQMAGDPDVEIKSAKDETDYKIENTTSPVELAEIYFNEAPEATSLNTAEKMISDFGLGKITEESYKRHGDRKNRNFGKTKAYFKNARRLIDPEFETVRLKRGNKYVDVKRRISYGRPIDVVAKELSDHYDFEITVQDIVDFIDKFENGEYGALSTSESTTAIAAKEKFSQLTGLPLDSAIAEIAINQQFAKQSKELQQIAEQDGLNEQQLREAYEKHLADTNNTTKEVVDTEVGEGAASEGEIQSEIEAGIGKDASSDTKKKVSDFFDSLKLDTSGKQSFALPIPPQLWNGFIEIVKQATLGGMTLADAVKQGVAYLKSENVSDEDIDKTTDQLLHVVKVKQNTRAIAPLTGAAADVSRKKIDNALNPVEKESPSLLSRLNELRKNLSFYIDNPNRYISRLQQNVEKYYKTSVGNLPLGRVFEQNARGRGMFKVKQFVAEVLDGLKKDQLADFHKYVFARRIIDRHEQMDKNAGPILPNTLPSTEPVNGGRDTGNITIEDAVTAIAELEQKSGTGAMLDFKQRADRMQDFMDENMQMLVESGVITKDAYEAIKSQNDFYAPFAVVQELARQNDNGRRAAVASTIIKKIKGISFKEGEYKVQDIETLQKELADGRIKKEEFYSAAVNVLENLLHQGAITDAEFAAEMGKLSNAGFAITNIFDKAASIIFDSHRIAHKNELMARIAKLNKLDKDDAFIRDVDGFENRTAPDGSIVKVPKRLDQIKVEDGFGVVSFRTDGKQKFLAIDRKAADTINGLDRRELEAWMQVVNKANAVFRVGVITLSPAFQAANLVIDFFRTAAMSKYGILGGKGIGDGLANFVLYVPQYVEAIATAGAANLGGKKTKLYEAFMKSDAFSTGMFDDPFQKNVKKLNISGKSTFDHIKYAGIDKLFDIMQGIGTTLEQSHKIVSLQRGLDIEGVERLGISKWKGEITKAKTPKEMTEAMDRIVYETQNYAGSPNFPATHSAMKMLSVVLQFFSARIKGEMTDYRRVVSVFGGNMEGIKLSKKERAQMLGQIAAVVTPMVLMAMLNNSDDEDEKEYDSLSPYDRDNNVNIPFGTFEYTDENGRTETIRNYIKTPVRGVFSSANVAANSFVKYMKKEDPETLKLGMMKILSNASPLTMHGDNANQLMESAFPGNTTPLFKWYLELAMNKNTFRHKDLKPFRRNKLYNEGRVPVFEVREKKTPQWAVDMSKYLKEGFDMEITPIALDHFENTMAGNVSETFGDNMVTKRFLRSDGKYPVYKDYSKPQ